MTRESQEESQAPRSESLKRTLMPQLALIPKRGFLEVGEPRVVWMGDVQRGPEPGPRCGFK